jgi:hypothetical protein
VASKKRRPSTVRKPRERTIGDVIRRPRNAEERDAEERANPQMFGERPGELTVDEFVETFPKFVRAYDEAGAALGKIYLSLLDAEADRLGVPRRDYRALALALIRERRKIRDRPIKDVHLKKGRPRKNVEERAVIDDQSLLDAEADRLGVKRDDALALELIIERRRIGDKSITGVHVKKGRPRGARKHPADYYSSK